MEHMGIAYMKDTVSKNTEMQAVFMNRIDSTITSTKKLYL
jgi:hypothetical protein